MIRSASARMHARGGMRGDLKLVLENFCEYKELLKKFCAIEFEDGKILKDPISAYIYGNIHLLASLTILIHLVSLTQQ